MLSANRGSVGTAKERCDQATFVTILTSRSRRMAKLIGRDERSALAVVSGYEDAATFSAAQCHAPDLDALEGILAALAPRWRGCIIGGEYLPSVDRARRRSRLCIHRPTAREWLERRMKRPNLTRGRRVV